MRRRLVEWLFERELDEDFELGIREGAERARLSDKARIEAMLEGASKSERAGLEKALGVLKANHKVGLA